MALKSDSALPGSVEEFALDAMLSASALFVFVLGAFSCLNCCRKRSQQLQKLTASPDQNKNKAANKKVTITPVQRNAGPSGDGQREEGKES